MSSAPTVRLADAEVSYGSKILWDSLNLEVYPGDFIAVLGPNGAGKTTLLRVLLGQKQLNHGTAEIMGAPVKCGSRNIGYIPQQKASETMANIRGRDLVLLGFDGNKLGIRLPSSKRRHLIDQILELVGATEFANRPISKLSGGEQQRLRIAQALITQPKILLCDEPLLSLDLHHQQEVVELINKVRKEKNISVLLVTHEINPILPLVDRLIYIAGGKAKVGSIDEVMQTEVLTQMYGAPVEVWRHNNRILVFSNDDPHAHPDPYIPRSHV